MIPVLRSFSEPHFFYLRPFLNSTAEKVLLIIVEVDY